MREKESVLMQPGEQLSSRGAGLACIRLLSFTPGVKQCPNETGNQQDKEDRK
jgi:hypothetical protein